jgi:hypothetical protein
MALGALIRKKSNMDALPKLESPSLEAAHFATKCQSLWRGHLVRRNYLPKETFLLAKGLPNITGLPQASQGVSKVYFPQDLPVVFKALGEKRSQRRFLTAWQARDLCKKNGYSHLLIPRSTPYGGYNIQERLPVKDLKQKDQVCLYEDNAESFTSAVQEFTGFLCQSIFPDILALVHPYQKSSDIPIGRYDNLPLMLQEGKGKIALIDLGGYRVREEVLSLDDAIKSVKTALFIFPYHFNEIFQIAELFCPEITGEKPSLEEVRDQVISQFKEICSNHKAFIQRRVGVEKRGLLEKVSFLMGESKEVSPEEKDLLLEEVITPVISRIMEKVPKGSCLSSLVCSRNITIDCSRFSIDAQRVLREILDNFLDAEEICYVNFYDNRVQQPRIRIHY